MCNLAIGFWQATIRAALFGDSILSVQASTHK